MAERMPWYSDDEELKTTVHAFSDNVAVVGADWNKVASTSDGGRTWTEVPKEKLSFPAVEIATIVGPSIDDLKGQVSFKGNMAGALYKRISIATDGNGWAVGPHGTIQKR